jgi:glycosyltransferase involved in cell wall biosynthesis
MKEPLVSIIIPTYNRKKTILRAIESVLNQTYKNWELIIVDDGSRDNTKEVIKNSLKNKKIRYYKTKNLGVCNARNYGAIKSKGEYIAFLDSDDEFEINKLKHQLGKMVDKNIDFSLSNRYEILEGNKVAKQSFKKSFLISPNSVISNSIPLSASLMVLKKKIMKKTTFDKGLPTSNDFDFILRNLNKIKILFIKTPLVKIHKTLKGDRISTDYTKKIEGYKGVLNKLNQNKYNLSPKEKKDLKKKMYSNIGVFKILGGDFKRGRNYLKQSFCIRGDTKIRNHILFLISYIPLLIRISSGIAKKLWRFNLIKN